jgi:hypothetical protein
MTGPRHTRPHGSAAVAAEELPEPSFPPVLVEELMRALGKVVRTRQLYLPNNPVYQKAAAILVGAFEALWKSTDVLVLGITEGEFRWEGRSFGQEVSKSDSLPWLLYKDGVRELRIERGFEERELGVLLDILQRLRKAAPDEEDLLTLLWEHEFEFFKYRYVDLAGDSGDGLLSPESGERPQQVPPPATMIADANAQAGTPDQPGIVRMDDFDATLYFLDEHEVDYLRGEIAAEYRTDLRRNVMAALFDIFENEPIVEVRNEIAEILEHMVVQYLATGEFATAAYMLAESRVAAERAPNLVPGQRERLLRLPERLSAPETLEQLIQALEDASALPPDEELESMFAQLRPGTLGLVLTWVGKSQNSHVRDTLARAARRLAADNVSELVKLTMSPDVTLAMEAVRLAGLVRTTAAVGALGKALGHEAPALRLSAVQALAEIASPGALRALETALEDEDRDIRVTAIRAIGAANHQSALSKVDQLLRNKQLRERDQTEQMAVFETYALLAGETGVAALDVLLNGRGGFLARKEVREIRACAAMGLGRIGSPDALDALRRAATDKDGLVRNAVNRAMRGGGA